MRTNRADQVLFLRALKDVVILDALSDRRRIDESFFGDGLVRIFENVQLQFRRGHGGEAHRLGTGELAAQHAARRDRHQLVLVLAIDVAQHQRRLRQPRCDAQRFEIGDGTEVAVAFRPRREGVAGHRIHFYVAGEEVIAGMHAVFQDFIDEEASDQTFADQSSIHVRKRGDDGVDLVVGYEPFERVGIDEALHDFLAHRYAFS